MTQKPDGQQPKFPARIPPAERAKNDAINKARLHLDGVRPEPPDLTYYTPILIQCTLPHSDPKTPTWVRKNGEFSLVLTSGTDTEGEFIGLPYGSFPRLVLAYIISRVIAGDGRRIEFSRYFSSFLNEIGYSDKGNYKGNSTNKQRIQGQFMRLIMTRITFQGREGTEERGAIAGANVNVANKFALWWDNKQPTQGSLFESFIDLSEDFYDAIQSNPIPLRKDMLANLKKSPLALDVYMWVSYRLFIMQKARQEQITVSYGRLQEQFGTGIAEKNYRNFRFYLKAAFEKVNEHWEEKSAKDGEKISIQHEFTEDGLILYRSPLLVAPKPPPAAIQEAQRVLSSRQFDQSTIKQARQIAGNFDIKYLQAQYFAWIDKARITPVDPRAHFLDFIKTHRQRHGESP